MSQANQSVVIHLDAGPDGKLRIRTIPPLDELDKMRQANPASLTMAELYGLSALVGIEDMRARLAAMGAALGGQ